MSGSMLDGGSIPGWRRHWCHCRARRAGSTTKTGCTVITSLSRILLNLHDRPNVRAVVTLITALLVVITFVDYLTGPEYALPVFYVVPVALAAWALGRTPGLVVAVIAGVCGAGAVVADPHGVSGFAIAWNATMRTLVYVGAAVAISVIGHLLALANSRASYDPLTGLWNRRRFHEEVERELSRARRTGSTFAFVYVDIDRLKECNDLEGHDAGDRLLVAFAEISRRQLRRTDLGARLGGDEFAFFLPDIEPGELGPLIDRLLDAYRAASRPIEVSAGIVTGQVCEGLEVDALVRAADALMYEVKKAGGDGCRVADLASLPGGPARPAS
jgi:diguanylate cyclase (GGDEF)-like protein